MFCFVLIRLFVVRKHLVVNQLALWHLHLYHICNKYSQRANIFLPDSGSNVFLMLFLSRRNLSNNKISVLEPGCFENISSTLLVLKLNRNRLAVLPSKVFKLPQLQFL